MLGSQVFALETPGAKLNYGVNKVRFPNPVQVGARIRGHVTIGEVTDLPTGKQLTVRHTIEIEGQAKPACVAETGRPARSPSPTRVGISRTAAARVRRPVARARRSRPRAPRAPARSGPGSSVCSVNSGCPARTASPGLACRSTPAPACTGSSLRARPAPSRQAAMPTAQRVQPGQHAVARRGHDVRLAGRRQRRVRVAALRARSSRARCPSPSRRPARRPGRRRPRPARREHLAGQRERSARRRRPVRRRRAPRPTRAPRCALPAVSPSGVDMSVSRATVCDAGVGAERDHRLGELARLVDVLHERAGADLHVEHQRAGALGDLLAHDRRRRSAGSPRPCR